MARHQRYDRAARLAATQVNKRRAARAGRRTASAGAGSGYDPFDPANYKPQSRGSSHSYVDVDTMDWKGTRRVASKFDLEVELLEEDGPGGGNSLVRVSGPAGKISQFLDYEKYDADAHPIKSSRTASAVGFRGPRRRPRGRYAAIDGRSDLAERMQFAHTIRGLDEEEYDTLTQILDGNLENLDSDVVLSLAFELEDTDEDLEEQVNSALDELLNREDIEDDAEQAVSEDVRRYSYMSRR